MDAFTREQVRNFYVSRTDNRSAKLQIQNKRRNGYDDVTFVFESIHKVHQFAALLSIADDYPQHRPITQESIRLLRDETLSQQEESKTAQSSARSAADVKDLKVLSITWNMGGSDKPVFKDQLSKFAPDVEHIDLIFFAAQECIRSEIAARISQLELYLKRKGFENID